MQDRQLKGTFLGLLEQVVVSDGFKRPRFNEGSGTKPGDNFLGEIQRVLIDEDDPEGRKSSLSLVIKHQPQNEQRRALYRSSLFFANEAFFYNDVITTFLDFQREKGITTNFSPPHPQCLLAGDLIILHDQGPLGYIMRDRLETLDRAHILLIMRELGRLHALSFALRDQRPTLFQRLTQGLKETLLPLGGLPAVKEFLTQAPERVLKKIHKYPEFCGKKVIDALMEFSIGFYEKLEQSVHPKDAEPYAVINHGDCWTNNLLFRYKEGHPEPESICFLDFQISRVASPACDISYLLYCCTDKPTRQAYYTEFLQEYHSSLGAYLARLGSDVDKLFPMEALQDQLRRYGKCGIGFCLAFVHEFTCKADEMPDLDTACQVDGHLLAETFTFTHSNDRVCWQRVYDAIDDAIELGYNLN